MNGDILKIVKHLEKEKGLERESLFQAIEAALLTASKKKLGEDAETKVDIDRRTGNISITCNEEEITLKDFGRIAAQTAKQVMIQKIREAEKDMIFQEFKPKEGELLSGMVSRFEHGNVIFSVGKTEAVLPHNERMPGEEFKRGAWIKVYVLEVRKVGRGPQLVVSRSDPGLVKQLFELEVPEIREGIVEIKSVAREPGSRSKICVHSKMENVDSVGACVGVNGARIKNIIKELGNEKIDIIPWSEDHRVFISNSLSPAEILGIELDKDEMSSTVSVVEGQLSLAIGKGGQNARLAARLTGWKIDIKVVEMAKELSLLGISEKIGDKLVKAGFKSVGDIARADKKKLMGIKGIGKKTVEKILKIVKEAKA